MQTIDDHPSCQTESRKTKGFLEKHKELVNILLLGIGFMFSMGSYSTCAMAQTVILNGIDDEYFTGTSTVGYNILCVVYGSTAISFLLAPSVSAVIGPKIAMVTGATFLLMYVVTFIRPLTFTLYLGAVAQGLGQGLIWTVYGFILSNNSNEKTIARNTGLFWCIFQSSLVSGNLFYYLMMQDAIASPERRTVIFGVLTSSAALGIIILCLLRHPWITRRSIDLNIGTKHHGPLQALTSLAKLQFSRKMLLLIPTFIYSGLDLSLYMSVYSTALGYTTRFGAVSEALVGLHGVFVGIGQIVGGLLFASLGKCAQKRGRDPALIVGLLTHVFAYFLVFINIPANASLDVTTDRPYLGTPSPYLAMLCSALFGFGDAAWINQICALLGTLFKDDCVSAFAVFQFVQTATTSAAFFYSPYLTMPYQLLINIIFIVLGAAGFCLVEWEAATEDHRMKYEAKKAPLAETESLLGGRVSAGEDRKRPIVVIEKPTIIDRSALSKRFDIEPVSLSGFSLT